MAALHSHLPRRPLGATGLEVSVLGFGASPLGGVFGDVAEDTARAAVHEAVRLGINLFDTSPYYGQTKSEVMLGKCLAGIPREEVIVATKVGRYGPEAFDFSASRVESSVAESLERLQCGYLDIVQCHDIEFDSLDRIATETLPALLRLKAAGLVRHIGVTGLPLKVFQGILDRVPSGTVDLVLSYCHYSLNDTSLDEIMPYLREKKASCLDFSSHIH